MRPKKLKLSSSSVVVVTAEPESVTDVIGGLDGAGYDVIMVKDGNRAINVSTLKPNNWKPSLFLVDLIIPGESGFVITKHLLEKYNDGRIPVILMTKHHSPEDVIEASQVGALGLLEKPVTLAAIKQLIEKEKIRRAKTEMNEMAFKINY